MYFLFYFNLFLFTLATSSQDDLVEKLSTTKWLCANQNCSEPIAVARGLNDYRGTHLANVDFNKNDKISILGKPSQVTPNNNDWWLVEAGSKKGVAPVRSVKEEKVIVNLINRVEGIVDFSSYSKPNHDKAESEPKTTSSLPSSDANSTPVFSYGPGEDVAKEVIGDVESAEVTSTKPFSPPTNVNPTIEGNSEHFNESHNIPKAEEISGAEINNSTETNHAVPADNNTVKETSAAENVNSYQTPQENDKIMLPTGPTDTQIDSSTNQTIISDKASPGTTSTTEVPKTLGSKLPIDGLTDFPNDPMNHSNETTNTISTEKEKKYVTDPSLIANETKTENIILTDKNSMPNENKIVNNFKPTANERESWIETKPSSNEKVPKTVTDPATAAEPETGSLIATPEPSDIAHPANTFAKKGAQPAKPVLVPATEAGGTHGIQDKTAPNDSMNNPNEQTVKNETTGIAQPFSLEPQNTLPNTTLPLDTTKETPASNLPNAVLNDFISNPDEQTAENETDRVAEPSLLDPQNTLPNTVPPLDTIQEIPTSTLPNTVLPLDTTKEIPAYTLPNTVLPVDTNKEIPANTLPNTVLPVDTTKEMPANTLPNTVLPIDTTKEIPANTLPNTVLPLGAASEIPAATPTPVPNPLPIDPSTLYNSQSFHYNYPSNVYDRNTYTQEKIISSEEAMRENQTDNATVSDPLVANVLESPDEVHSELSVSEQKEFEDKGVKHLPDSDNIDENAQDEISSTSLPFPYDDYYKGPADITEEGSNWFSGFSSVMDSIKDMFAKSDVPVVDQDSSSVTTEEMGPASGGSGATPSTPGTEMNCENDPYCSQFKDDISIDDDDGKGNNSGAFEGFFIPDISLQTLACLIITSIVVLLFSLGHYYLENLKQDTALAAKVNTVSTELFFAQKELATIEEQFQRANENYQRLLSENSNSGAAIDEMRRQLEESQRERKVLEDQVKRMESEIESLVEEGDEMHRMLAESFNEEERTKSLLANISDLKGVLAERLQEIVSLTEQLDTEKQEVELLTISLKKSDEQKEATEEKLAKVLNEADSNTLTVTKEFEEKISTLERIIEERSLERANFEKQICELNGTCEGLMVEKELAEKALKKAHGVSSGKGLSEWLEAKQIRTDFLAIQKEVEKLKKALNESKQQTASLEVKEQEHLNEIEALNNKYESAEKDKIEALTKLQVLSNYFSEKEIQLQEELGTKEAQWLQKQSEDHTIYEQMRSLREENLSYKAQNEALKKEILDQETSFKIQIANEEQKAQENWINLRHTERRLKEVQMEASHLRSRLTALETNTDSLEDKHKGLDLVNGDASMGAASPPFMLYPPPDFIPPPPLVSPSRPPPLGRLSSPSPPLTPPAPLSPFEYYPPPPPSPPHRVHKPQPREPHRKQKDSQSSNHSSESTEKSVRRGKR